MNKFFLTLVLFTTYAFSWDFEESTIEAGLLYQHGFDQSVTIEEPQRIASGIAIGDVNGDGWDDIFVVTGETLNAQGINTNPNKLFIAQQDGTYVDMASAYNLSDQDVQSSGPLIVDLNGDGLRDLIFGSVGTDPKMTIYINNDNQSFTKINNSIPSVYAYGISAADTDKDGDMDIFISRWLQDEGNAYWMNDGNAQFSNITDTFTDANSFQSSFTPIFVDINNNNWVDLLVTSDFFSSKYFINDQSGFMTQQDRTQITDENGMGASVGDYDNDGDFDWFVSSIFDEDGKAEGSWGVSGNRLYNNDGNGNFQDVSIPSDVNRGYWGWGSCFADFNNDMHLDIFHVNGFNSLPAGESDFINDPSRMYINNQNGFFTERSEQLNIIDREMGRAIICHDYDRDGDIDILIANNQGQSRLYKNNLDNNYNYLTIKLHQDNKNIDAIGAKIHVTSNGITQLRQVQAGGSFASSVGTEQYFGLGENTTIETITVTWPDDTSKTLTNVSANQFLIINKGLTINGLVKNAADQLAISALSLQLYSVNGELISQTMTNDKGQYSFSNLTEGDYLLVTNSEDFVNQAYPNNSCGLNQCVPSTSQTISISADQSLDDILLISSNDYYPNLNGLWFNADQSGHGLQIEVVSIQDKPTLFASWYAHLNGQTIWLTGTGELNKGIAELNMSITNGASFPPNFNSDDVVTTPWGTISFNFSDFNSAVINWDTDDVRFEDGQLSIQRLTRLSDTVTNNENIDACLSGTFFNTDQNGHGIMLEVLGQPAASIVVTWFTYNTQGEQLWLLANGAIDGNSATLNTVYTQNTSFPPNFDADAVMTIDWGSIQINKISNDKLMLNWTPNEQHQEFGDNSLEMTRLTRIKGNDITCN